MGIFWISNGYYDKILKTSKEVTQAVNRLTPVLAYFYLLPGTIYSCLVLKRSEMLGQVI